MLIFNFCKQFMGDVTNCTTHEMRAVVPPLTHYYILIAD